MLFSVIKQQVRFYRIKKTLNFSFKMFLSLKKVINYLIYWMRSNFHFALLWNSNFSSFESFNLKIAPFFKNNLAWLFQHF
jgi:hypothetical protein